MVKMIEEDYFSANNHTDARWLNIKEFLEIPFVLADGIRGNFPTPILQLESRRAPTDYFTVGSLKLVSPAFRRLLESVQAEMEYFPVNLLTKRGDPYTGGQYFFAHLLKEINCFDYLKSKFEYDEYRPNQVHHISSLVLREVAVGDEPIFWIDRNACFPRWFVSEQFAEQIKRAGLTGIVLTRLEDAIPK